MVTIYFKILRDEAMKIDKKIEIVKLIQRIFDNCSESEGVVGTNSDGDDRYATQLELVNICRAIERTLEDLVNEKLRVEP